MMTIPAFIIDHQLDQDADERSIKRAYAKALKKIDQEHDLDGFQSLRESYEYALTWVRNKAWREAQVDRGEESATQNQTEDFPTSAQETLIEQLDIPAHLTFEQRVEPPQTDTEVSASAEPSAIEEDTSLAPDPVLETSTPVIYAIDVARQLHAELMEKIRIEANAAQSNVGKTEAVLRHLLDDVRLINVEIRELFEWTVAEHLSQGWQEGNGDLFGAAVKCFRWDQDRNRLLGFDGFGYYLDRALNEVNAFNQQEQHRGNPQFKVIRLARDNTTPTKQFLRKNIAFINEMLAVYPTWLSVVTNIDNLKEWSRRAEAYNFFQPPNISFGFRKTTPSGFPWTYRLGLLILFALVRIIMSGTNS